MFNLKKIKPVVLADAINENYLVSKYTKLIGFTIATYIFMWWYVGMYIIMPFNVVMTLSIFLITIFVNKKWITANLGLNLLLVFGYIEIMYVSFFTWHHTSLILDWLMMIPISAFLFFEGYKKAIYWAIPCIAAFFMIPTLNHLFIGYFLKYEHYDAAKMNIVNVISIIFLFVDILLLSIDYANIRDLYVKLLKDQNDELILAQHDIIETQKYKDRFFANISHELRTPMNAIQGISELLSSDIEKTESDELIASLKTSSHHLISVIGDILDYSKIQEGKLELVNSVIDLPEVLNNSFGMLKYNANNKNIDYRIKFETPIVQNIESDKQRLQQIIVNLLSNAIKFTQDGIVEMRCSILHNQTGTSSIRIEIQDTGIGISDENLDKLFESYNQADAYISIKFGGTGLGLNICKKLVQMLNGKIGCTSKVGSGSIFFIEIPIKVIEQSSLVSSEKIASGSINLIEKINPKLSFLIVDDNQMNLTITKKILQKSLPECDVDTCEDGLQSISFTTKKKYDIILMDLQMPVMNGIEASLKIRSDKNNLNRNSAIIAFTANANEFDSTKCMEAGMNDVITKPFELKVLIEKIYKFSNAEFHNI